MRRRVYGPTLPPKGKKRARHFLTWWSVITLMLLCLGGTFAFGALLLGYVAWIGMDPAQTFGSLWHPAVAIPLGLFGTIGSGWLFVYGVKILNGVISASREMAVANMELNSDPPPSA